MDMSLLAIRLVGGGPRGRTHKH